jgi:hypothetical protein
MPRNAALARRQPCWLPSRASPARSARPVAPCSRRSAPPVDTAQTNAGCAFGGDISAQICKRRQPDLGPEGVPQNARAALREMRHGIPAVAQRGTPSALLFQLVPALGKTRPRAARAPPPNDMLNLRHHVRADPRDRAVLLVQLQGARLAPASTRKSASAGGGLRLANLKHGPS